MEYETKKVSELSAKSRWGKHAGLLEKLLDPATEGKAFLVVPFEGQSLNVLASSLTSQLGVQCKLNGKRLRTKQEKGRGVWVWTEPL